jgi:hypothetical protein
MPLLRDGHPDRIIDPAENNMTLTVKGLKISLRIKKKG